MSVFLYCSTYLQCCSRWGEGDSGGTCYDRRRAEALGPVRNPVLQHSTGFDVGPLPPRSSSPPVAGCQLGGYPAGRDRWGGERVMGGALPRINIGGDVWGESNIMTGVYQRWCSSTLHIGWGLVLVCRGRYGLGGVFLLFILGSNLGGGVPVRGLRGGRRRVWCEEWARSG